jgi:hypothetical protein
MATEFSMLVVGGAHPNADGSNRQFNALTCSPGDGIELRPEPNNKFDPQAVAVFTDRCGQLGYLPANRCGWIGSKLRDGADVRAIFQELISAGPVIRVNLIGQDPVLPKPVPTRKPPPAPDDFYPDPEWPDIPDEG